MRAKKKSPIVTESDHEPCRGVEARLQAMIDAGLAHWDGKRLEVFDPLDPIQEDTKLSEIVLEGRR